MLGVSVYDMVLAGLVVNKSNLPTNIASVRHRTHGDLCLPMPLLNGSPLCIPL